jgi:hypothetical protein
MKSTILMSVMAMTFGVVLSASPAQANHSRFHVRSDNLYLLEQLRREWLNLKYAPTPFGPKPPCLSCPEPGRFDRGHRLVR